MDKQQLSPTEPQQQLSSEQKQALNKQLLTAVRGKNESEVKELLKNGAEINAVDINGMTSLMLACQNNNVKIVELLLNNHANKNIQSLYGHTAFSLTCWHGNLDIVKLLLNNNADIKNVQNPNGNTALMLACWHGNLDIVKFLIDKGADVNSQNHDGMSAFSLACSNGNLDIVKFLIENGADVRNDLENFNIEQLRYMINGLVMNINDKTQPDLINYIKSIQKIIITSKNDKRKLLVMLAEIKNKLGTKFRTEKLGEIASLNTTYIDSHKNKVIPSLNLAESTTYIDSHKNKVIPSLTLAESKKGGCCNIF